MSATLNDFHVYVCPHVLEGERPVLDVVHDYDDSWQFLCGHDFPEPAGGPQKMEAATLLSRDESLRETLAMERGAYAEREAADTVWVFGELD